MVTYQGERVSFLPGSLANILDLHLVADQIARTPDYVLDVFAIERRGVRILVDRRPKELAPINFPVTRKLFEEESRRLSEERKGIIVPTPQMMRQIELMRVLAILLGVTEPVCPDCEGQGEGGRKNPLPSGKEIGDIPLCPTCKGTGRVE